MNRTNPPSPAYLYLHGFASSPQSAKARYLSDRFQSLSLPLTCPDLNQGDFFHLTLSRQLEQVSNLYPPKPTPVVMIGSSLGGLTAACLGERSPQVDRLVLLAPAFGFLDHWLPKLGAEEVREWQRTGQRLVYHYALEQSVPLSYEFVTDAARYDARQLQRPIPTLILHGTQDEVIPIQSSRDYAASRPWVELIELESDHALGDEAQPQIWQAIQQFCQFLLEARS